MYTHTRNRGIRTRLHTCMHRYARSGLCIHTPARSLTHRRASTLARPHAHTHTRTHAQANKEAGSVHLRQGDVTHNPQQQQRFHLIKTRENKNYKQRGEFSSRRLACFDPMSFVKSSRTGGPSQSLAQYRVSLFCLLHCCTEMHGVRGGQIPFAQKVNNYRGSVKPAPKKKVLLRWQKRVCFRFYFRQWRCTSVEMDSWFVVVVFCFFFVLFFFSAKVMLVHPRSVDISAHPRQSSHDETCVGFLSGKRKHKSNVSCVPVMFRFCFLKIGFPFFFVCVCVAFVITVTEKHIIS